jgi:hypothetical protein
MLPKDLRENVNVAKDKSGPATSIEKYLMDSIPNYV